MQKEKGISTLIGILIIIVVVVVLFGGVFAYQYFVIKTNNQPQVQSQQNTISSGKNEHSSDITNVQETNNPDFTTYVNKDMGYSIDVPKLGTFADGSMCRWDGSSYRPADGTVPVKVVANGNMSYIVNSYYYKLGGETIKNNIHYFSTCDKIITSINDADSALVKNNIPIGVYVRGWAIKVESVKNDQELENYIKNNYGSGCSLGQKTLSNQQVGAYDVVIKGDGKDLESTACPVNYAYKIKYYPTRNAVASWNIGQAVSFLLPNGNEAESTMINSFRFLTK